MLLSILSDPFATKGVEYLLVIAFLPLLALFWRVIRTHEPSPVPAAPALAAIGIGSDRWFQVVPDHYYHPGHTWARPADDGVVRVGMDDFAQKLLGRPARIRLPEVGAPVAQGAGASGVQVDSRSVDLLSPVSGVVVRRNEALLRDPNLVNRDPYGEGWLFEVTPTRMEPDLRTLLRGDVVRAWMDTTLGALQKRMHPDVAFALQDGGVPVSGMARAISPEAWDEIAREFLLSQ